MRKIKPENIKIGDFIYLTGKKNKDFRCIVEKTSNKKREIAIFNVFWLKDKSKSTYFFEPRNTTLGKNPLSLHSATFDFYTIYKLNKKQILEFKKLLIINSL